MASEADSGPRYAPDDPALPKPWKGLLHGNNGVVYYWNPETNVTQYERPMSEPPPTVPAVSVPQSDSMAAAQSVQLNGMLAQHGQYTQNVPQKQTQYMNQVPQLHRAPGAQQVAAVEQPAYQQAPQMAQVGHQGSQPGSSFQPQYMQYGQGMQPKEQKPGPVSAQQGQALYHQPAAQMGQQPSHQAGQNMSQHGFMQMQFSQQTPSHQGTPMGQPMQPHFSHQQPQQHHQQQPQYMQYSQSMPGPGYQGGAHQAQYMQQGPSYSYQPERNIGYPQRVDNDQGGFPKAPSQAEQGGNVGPRSTTALNTPNTSRAGDLSNQFPAFGCGTNTQPSNANDMLPKTAPELHPHHGLHYENKMGTPMRHGQQHGLPPGGSNVSYEGAQQGRDQREYPLNDNKSVPAMAPDQPRLATVPSTRFQQEMRSGSHWNGPPGVADGMHAVVDHGFPKKYSHAGGELPLQSHAMMREPPSVPGSSDMGLLSSAEAYRKQHEVTATGENVPAPFMTFEATGFPPEILREVRYLLQNGEHMSYAALLAEQFTCNKYSYGG
ncbi:DEAD-box ATP-dependent RNA helicase 40-like protein [Drosera capensis]